MKNNKVARKLAAILYADVVGYSRLSAKDEIGTHRALGESLDTITTLVSSYDGRVLNFAGDAVLAEFASVVNALDCAVAIQRDLETRNENLPGEQKLQFRIGLNLGDVIVDRQEIFGDGVNIAARLETLAEPGGICVSQAVFDQVKNKVNLGYEYLGERKVKNIPEAVSAYRILAKNEARGTIKGKPTKPWANWKRILSAVVGLAIIGVVLLALWRIYPPPPSSTPELASRGLHDEWFPAKPSIVVLPLNNLSGDSAQEYFSDGITDSLITDLSRYRQLFVIASNTAFSYKDKPVNIQHISRELRVRYVLEGSLQKAADTVRVNVRLIDGASGHPLWAERLARSSTDLFELQDEIVRTIVASLATEVDEAERARAMRKGTDNLVAYDYVLRGREYRLRTTRAANHDAIAMFKRAIAFDPRYGDAYTGLGWCHYDSALYGWTPSPSEALERAHALARNALDIDESNSDAYHLVGSIHLKWMEYGHAIKALERALTLNPNDAGSYDALGEARLFTGLPEDAIDAIQIALRFNPNAPPRALINLGLAYYLTGHYDEAIAVSEQASRRNAELAFPYVVLAAAYAQTGRAQDAERTADQVRRLSPFFEVESFGSGFRDPRDRDKLAEGLRKAGLE